MIDEHVASLVLLGVKLVGDEVAVFQESKGCTLVGKKGGREGEWEERREGEREGRVKAEEYSTCGKSHH